jgi:hypothetical protein
MWLRELRVQNLKRLRDFSLDLRGPDDKPRMWTVLIGPNGTGKTSVLQAIALAAAGSFRANDLLRDLTESLPDKRQERVLRVSPLLNARRAVPVEVSIAADFVFAPLGCAPEFHPSTHAEVVSRLSADNTGTRLRSRLSIRADRPTVGRSMYVDSTVPALSDRAAERSNHVDPTNNFKHSGDPEEDVLAWAREGDVAHWFVAGYGVQRDLPETALSVPTMQRPAIDRLRPLFGRRELIGPNFTALFDSKKTSLAYAKLLRDVLLRTEALVPGITDIELRGKGGVTKAEHLTDSHRFEQSVHGNKLKLPARWLSHGYQSSLAWISDLVGQVVLEAPRTDDPKSMEGLVLIDEIDLYLHPSWQVGLIEALRDTLPNMQFIVTTHSPILLSAFRRDEVVMLDYDDEGNVVHVETPRDPRLLTGSELYESFFGIDRLYPAELGDKLDLYTRIARNPSRSDDEESTRLTLEAELRAEGIKHLSPPKARTKRTATG